MILSHSRRFIFLKTRKTGGTSFEIALSKYMSDGDVITPVAPGDESLRAAQGFRGPQNYLFEDDPLNPGSRMPPPFKFYNHMEAGVLRARVPAQVFEGYFKAAMVRNPFDFVVSWYYWERARLAPTSREDFRLWLMFHYAKRAEIEARYRQRLQTNPGPFYGNRLITHIDGRSVVDLMIRYEHLEADITTFADRAGLPASLHSDFRSLKAKSGYRPPAATSRAMFEGFPEGRKIIEEMFAEDIEAYDYALT